MVLSDEISGSMDGRSVFICGCRYVAAVRLQVRIVMGRRMSLWLGFDGVEIWMDWRSL